MKASVARKHGWRPIVSEAQATALMRRELKKLRGVAQRDTAKIKVAERWFVEWVAMRAMSEYDQLLLIKVGTWYKFVKLCDGNVRLCLLCNVVDDEKSPVSQSE